MGSLSWLGERSARRRSLPRCLRAASPSTVQSVSMTVVGTFETCRPALRTSVDRGRPEEVVGAQVKTTHTDRRYLPSYPASVLSGLLI
jgi:hypothetical protein